MYDLALFYLARKVEGLGSFWRFVESYKAHPAGCPHQLVIIYKGFEGEDDPDLIRANELFSEVASDRSDVYVTDEHFDIGAYIQAARQIDAKYVCFVNTHTDILADNWLAHLRNAIEDESVGVAGASASYESLYDSLALTTKAVWLAGIECISFDQKLAEHYDFILKMHVPHWLDGQPIKEHKHGHFYGVYLAEKWDAFWRSTLEPGKENHFLADFARFPNPHVRSNGFIVRRADFLRFNVEPTKKSTYGFESGPNGLSITMLREGKRLVLVDRNGQCLGPEQWPTSGCFRSGNQENLMIADNQTRSYDGLTQPEKDTHLTMSWGDSFKTVSGGNPLGFTFSMKRTRPRGSHETSSIPYIADHLDYGVPHKFNYEGPGGSRWYIRDDTVWPHSDI